MPYNPNDAIPDNQPADATDILGLSKSLGYVYDASLSGVYKLRPVTPGDLAATPSALLTLKRQETLAMTGSALALPAAPAGASRVTVQPQGGDVRSRLDGATTAPTLTSGVIWYEGGEYDVQASDFTAVRVIGAAGVSLELVWRG